MEAFNQTHSAQLQRDVELNEFLIGSWEAFCQHVPVLQRSWATASRTLTQEISHRDDIKPFGPGHHVLQ